VGTAIRLILATGLGIATALLASCGGGGKGLIPVTNAGPLQSDFDAIAQAVSTGDCSATASALRQARADLRALPSTVDPGLRNRLSQGVANLDSRAPSACQQAQTTASTQSTASAPTTTATSTPTTTSTTTTPPPTTSSSTTTTAPPPTTSTPTTTSAPPAGGTPAPNGGAAAPGQGANGQ
jgi:hypothetical protein